MLWGLFLLATWVKGDISVHIAGFFPMGLNVSEGAVGRGVLPAVKLALFHINNDKRILKGISSFLSFFFFHVFYDGVFQTLNCTFHGTTPNAAPPMA